MGLARALRRGTRIVTGDTKVVVKGKGDGMFINRRASGGCQRGATCGRGCGSGDAI
jgi:hydrogenase maturation factor